MAVVAEIPDRPSPPTADVHAPSVRFSEWRRKHAGTDALPAAASPAAFATPVAADTVAGAIVDYWEIVAAAGDFDPEKPLYVLELAAGDGRLAYRMIKALHERLAQRARTPLRFCYIATDPDERYLDFIETHPYLREWIDARQLDTARWDPEVGGPLRLRARAHRIARTDNPLVVIASGVFCGLAHELFGFQYGHMFEARVVETIEGTYPIEATDIATRWLPTARADWPASIAALAEAYRARLESAAVLLPGGALCCVEHLAALAQERYLLLCADRGVATEQEIRFGYGADVGAGGHGPLPVNFHALAEHQHRRGAYVWTDRRRENGPVVQIALRGGDGDVYERGFAALVRRLETSDVDGGDALADMAASVAAQLSPARWLALVRASGHDPRVLAGAFEPLLAKLDDLTAESCRHWRDALVRAWANYFPSVDGDPFHFNLGLLAAHLGHWALAREAFRLGLAICTSDTATHYHLALCEASTGHVPHAIALLEQAIEQDPTEPGCRELHQALTERTRRWDATPWYRRDIAVDEELALEPIGVEHIPALIYQRRDPQIGIMARLADLETPQDGQRWLDEEYGESGRATYAIMHAGHGFVGVVSMCRADAAAYFYFWIGTDYQGAGLGRRAAGLLFRHAAALGITDVFTSAYADNARSRHALDSLGFARVDIVAREPDQDLVFFHLPLAHGIRAGWEAVARLRALCGAIDSPIVFRDTPVPPDRK